MRYAFDLAALPIGSIIVAVDGWGENPMPLRVMERETHHVVGETSSGARVFIGGPLVKRMATAEEAAPFFPKQQSTPSEPRKPAALAPVQMEIF